MLRISSASLSSFRSLKCFLVIKRLSHIVLDNLSLDPDWLWHLVVVTVYSRLKYPLFVVYLSTMFVAYLYIIYLQTNTLKHTRDIQTSCIYTHWLRHLVSTLMLKSSYSVMNIHCILLTFYYTCCLFIYN